MNSYAGDKSVQETWTMLRDTKAAVLVDVRTRAEWSFVGMADLTGLNKEPVMVEWQMFPSMERNAQFASAVDEQLQQLGVTKQDPVFFICRSGQRSQASAIAMTELGYSACYNVAGGFEGDLDADGHRGTVGGWKASGLPWRQS